MMPTPIELDEQTADQLAVDPQVEAEKKAEALRAKEERAADAAEAMREFEAEKTKLLDNTLRLRALRLAREAEAVRLKGEKALKTAKPTKPASARISSKVKAKAG